MKNVFMKLIVALVMVCVAPIIQAGLFDGFNDIDQVEKFAEISAKQAFEKQKAKVAGGIMKYGKPKFKVEKSDYHKFPDGSYKYAVTYSTSYQVVDSRDANGNIMPEFTWYKLQVFIGEQPMVQHADGSFSPTKAVASYLDDKSVLSYDNKKDYEYYIETSILYMKSIVEEPLSKQGNLVAD